MRIRLRSGSNEVESSALLNSGFETDSPDVAVPVRVARALGLWPPSRMGELITLDTGGGEAEAYLFEGAAELELVLEDRRIKPILVNVIVNPSIGEILLSDYVASELGIVLLDFKRGLWRLNDEDKVRTSVELSEWR